MKYSSLLSMFLAFLFIGAIFVVGGPGDGQDVNTFNGSQGPASDTVELVGSGSELYDPHIFVDLEKNVPISDASMKITTMDTEYGPWINNPAIDVGMDNDPEWAFGGTGYGDFGRNTYFSDDDVMKTSTYNGGQTKTMGQILVPADATVHQSDITLRGRFEPTIPGIQELGSGGTISYTPQRLKVGDLTGDGLNDTIVSTGQPGSLYLYENVGSTSFESSSLGLSSVYDFAIYDVDDDDDNDLVFSTSNGLHWRENTGSGTISSITMTISNSFSPYLIETADMDGDGEVELITAKRSFAWAVSETAIMMYMRENGTAHYEWPILNTGSGTGTSYLDFLKIGDWNDDDHLDVFGAFNDRKVMTFQNPGSSSYYNDTTNLTSKTSWSKRTVFTESYTIYGFDVGDVDKDGDADVVTAPFTYSSSIYYWKNNGASTWSKYSTLSGYSYYPRTASLVDLDADGYLDIFYSVGNSNWNNRIGWLDSGGSPNKNNWARNELMSGHPNYGYGGYTGDLNDDGYIDAGLFISTSKQALVWYNNYPHDGSNISPGFVEDGGLVELADLEHYDVDGDKDIDLLITATVSGTVGWYENDGSPYDGQWEFHRINGVIVGGAKEVAPGDIDGDGDVDVAVTSYDTNSVMWFENPGNSSKLWDYHKVGVMNYAYGVGVIDMDNDGDMEIVASAGYYYNDGIRGYYHNGDPDGTWSYFQVARSLSYCGAINITDMNNDGYDDILVPVNGYSGSANIYRNPYPKNPKTNSWTAISAISGLSYPQEVIPIDIDGNGVLDVVSASNYGNIKWGRAPNNANSTGGWNSFDIATSGAISYPWGVEVGDIDEDGFADVFITNNYRWNWAGANDRGLYWFEEGDDNTETWKRRILDSNSKSTYGVAVADMDGDGVIEIFVNSRGEHKLKVSRPSLNYPSDVKIDLGDDGVVDWSYTNVLNGIVEMNMKDELQRVLDTQPSGVSVYLDQYDNRMMSIPVTLSTDTRGRLTAWGMDIRYNVTFDIENGGAMKRSLDRIIPDYDDRGDQKLRVYILFKGKTEGRALISDLMIEYNAPPKQKGLLPIEIEVYEDSTKENFLDLSQFFIDDYDPSHMLRYSAIMMGEHKDKVNVYIENGANVSVDSTIVKNFNKEVYVKFTVEDNGGPGGVPSRKITTKPIKIDIIPTDDPPIRGNGTIPPKIYGYEGQEIMALDLEGRYLFEDPDDPLGINIKYFPKIDPDGSYPQDIEDIVEVRIVRSNLYVKSKGEWSGLNIPLRIFGYDTPQADTTSNPYHTTSIDILNINDGPVWLDIPDIEIDEDTSIDDILDLSPYAADIDTPPLELNYKLISQTNSTHCKAYLDPKDKSKVNFDAYTAHWHGIITVEVEVSDGIYTDTTKFSINVMSVNDVPSVRIKNPVEDSPIDPGEFSIVGEARDVEGIDKVEVLFEGTWTEAVGKNSWGVTLVAPDFGKMRTDVPLQVKVTDTDGVSIYGYLNITVLKKIIPPITDNDGDGYTNSYDLFPDDPSEWSDRDGDKVGDNSDPFPDNREWSSDVDKDGIPDIAEEDDYLNDPENKKPSIGPVSKEEGRDYNLLIPIVLTVIALILATVLIISIVSYRNKKRASLDPRMAVVYYNRMEERRIRFRRVSGRDRLEKLLSRAQLNDKDRRSRPASGPMPLPTKYGGGRGLPAPHQASAAMRLPPAQQRRAHNVQPPQRPPYNG